MVNNYVWDLRTAPMIYTCVIMILSIRKWDSDTLILVFEECERCVYRYNLLFVSVFGRANSGSGICQSETN